MRGVAVAGRRSDHSLPPPTYTHAGGLWQDPGGAQNRRPTLDPADMEDLRSGTIDGIHSTFDLPDRLAAKADPALIADDERHFAAVAESLAHQLADLSDRLDAERRAPGGIGQQAMDRDLEIHRLTARLRTLRRFSLDLCLGRMVGRGRHRAGVRRTARPHRQRGPPAAGRLALARRPSRSSAPPTPTRWAWPAAAGTAGPAAGSPTTGTRCSAPDGLRGARRARRPVRLHRQPGRQPVAPDARRARHHPGRPGRHHPGRVARRARRRRRPGYRQDRRRPAPHRLPALLRSAARPPPAAACCSSARTSPTWPTSPTSCPASARRTCRPAPCATSSPRAPRRRPRPTRTVARLKSSADLVRAIEAAVRFYEEPPTSADDRRRSTSAEIRLERRRLGRGVRGRTEPGTPHNEARDQVWAELLTILIDKYDGDEPPDLLRRTLLQNKELLTAFNRAWPLLEADRPRRRPVVGARLPAQVRALARAPTRSASCSARTPRRGRCPTCRCWTRPGSGSATRRRPGAGAGTGRRRRRAGADGRVVDDLLAAEDDRDAR